MKHDIPTKIAFRICDYLNIYSERPSKIPDRDELRNMGVLLPINEQTPSSFYGKVNKRGYYKTKEKDHRTKLDIYRVTKIITNLNRLYHFQISEHVKKEYLILERINQMDKIKSDPPRAFRYAAIFVPYKLEMFVKNQMKEEVIRIQSMELLAKKTINSMNRKIVTKELNNWDWCFRQMRESFLGRSDDGWRKAFLRCKAGLEGIKSIDNP